jgi:hypothetical protein
VAVPEIHLEAARLHGRDRDDGAIAGRVRRLDAGQPRKSGSWLAIAPSEDAGVVLTGASTAEDWYWTGNAKVATNASTATLAKTIARRRR